MSNKFYTLWHGGFAPVKRIFSWVEGPGWVGDKPNQRYWSTSQKVWKVQVLDCQCGNCDRTRYQQETTYPDWAGGMAVDNRVTTVTATLFKTPDFKNPVEKSL